MRGTARGAARVRERTRTRREREKKMEKSGLAVGFVGGGRTAVGGASLDVGAPAFALEGL